MPEKMDKGDTGRSGSGDHYALVLWFYLFLLMDPGQNLLNWTKNEYPKQMIPLRCDKMNKKDDPLQRLWFGCYRQ